jgi:hypothetical protein
MVAPPSCIVCGQYATSPNCGLVEFADYDPDWKRTDPRWASWLSSPLRYATGVTPPQAPGRGRLCERHLPLAQALRHLTASEVVSRLRTLDKYSGSPTDRTLSPPLATDREPTVTLRLPPKPTPPERPQPEAPREVEQAVASDAQVPAPFEQLWPLSSWRGEGSGTAAPPCPHCGKPVRSAEARRDRPLPGYANPPWNAGWDGTCEACGATFELVVRTPLHLDSRRTTTVRPASKAYRTFVDEGVVLSGVEIEVAGREFGENQPRTEKLFLSMAEATRLADALKKSLRLYREQLDWSHDWT